MSRQGRNQHSKLYNALLPIALVLGGLIIAALIVTWITNSSRADVADADSGEINAEVIADFDAEYDALGIAVGADDAPVTIREFADYQCPSCRAFAPTAKRIRDELVTAGKVRFVFFDFPLDMHEHAFDAAVAARCAGYQDSYWPYQEKLFAQQAKWAEASDPVSNFLDIAVETGLDTSEFKQCMAGDKASEAVADSRELAVKLGIRATPTIMVDAHVFTGNTGYDRIRELVDSSDDD